MSIYTPHTDREEEEMLFVIGAKSLDDLYSGLEGYFAKNIDLPSGKSQQEVEKLFDGYAAMNKVFRVILRGGGAYDRYIPPVVRSLTERSEFVTAYTPYQAEMSQGLLETIFEYQTTVARLTGMDVSNASHYDGATALADGILMLRERNKSVAVLSEGIAPEIRRVAETYFAPLGVSIRYVPLAADGKTDKDALAAALDDKVFAVAIAQPNYYGVIEDAKEIGTIVKSNGIGYVNYVEPISQTVLACAGECGADVAAAEGQSLGLELSFGGPYLGMLACKQKYMRKLVGRIVGQTEDSKGNTAYVLTLQAREQHIRREKASSSICSNEAHCALSATVYVAAMGLKGLKEVAYKSVNNAHRLCNMLEEIGFKRKFSAEFFNEFVTECDDAERALKLLETKGILGGILTSPTDILWCCTEKQSEADLKEAATILKEGL